MYIAADARNLDLPRMPGRLIGRVLRKATAGSRRRRDEAGPLRETIYVEVKRRGTEHVQRPNHWLQKLRQPSCMAAHHSRLPIKEALKKGAEMWGSCAPASTCTHTCASSTAPYRWHFPAGQWAGGLLQLMCVMQKAQNSCSSTYVQCTHMHEAMTIYFPFLANSTCEHDTAWVSLAWPTTRLSENSHFPNKPTLHLYGSPRGTQHEHCMHTCTYSGTHKHNSTGVIRHMKVLSPCISTRWRVKQCSFH